MESLPLPRAVLLELRFLWPKKVGRPRNGQFESSAVVDAVDAGCRFQDILKQSAEMCFLAHLDLVRVFGGPLCRLDDCGIKSIPSRPPSYSMMFRYLGQSWIGTFANLLCGGIAMHLDASLCICIYIYIYRIHTAYIYLPVFFEG